MNAKTSTMGITLDFGLGALGVTLVATPQDMLGLVVAVLGVAAGALRLASEYRNWRRGK